MYKLPIKNIKSIMYQDVKSKKLGFDINGTMMAISAAYAAVSAIVTLAKQAWADYGDDVETAWDSLKASAENLWSMISGWFDGETTTTELVAACKKVQKKTKAFKAMVDKTASKG